MEYSNELIQLIHKVEKQYGSVQWDIREDNKLKVYVGSIFRETFIDRYEDEDEEIIIKLLKTFIPKVDSE